MLIVQDLDPASVSAAVVLCDRQVTDGIMNVINRPVDVKVDSAS